jgi:hypothetical protein
VAALIAGYGSSSDALGGTRGDIGQFVRTAIDMLMAVTVWKLTRAPGTRAWVGAGLLLGNAILGVGEIPFLLGFVSPNSLSNRIRYFHVVLVEDLLFIAVALLAVAALVRMRPPPWPHHRLRRSWVAGLVACVVVAAGGYLAAFFLYSSSGSFYFRVIFTAVMAVALPLYGLLGRPTALAAGLLASWFSFVLPIVIGIFNYWNDFSSRSDIGVVVFGLPT